MNFPNQGRDPMDQKRLLMAVAACGAILLLWNFLFPAPVSQPPPDGAPASAASVASAAAPLSAAPASAAGPVIERKAVASLVVAGRQTAVFTNDDGQLLSWDLEEDQYRVPGEGKGETLPWQLMRDLVRTEAGKGLFLPPRLEVELGGVRARGDYRVLEKTDQKVVFGWTDPTTGVKLTRSWEMPAGGYTATLTLAAENPGGAAVPYGLQAVTPGAQNNKEAGGSMFSPPVYAFEGVCRRGEDFERSPIHSIISDLEDPDDPTSWSDGITWAGVDNRYFMAAVMPKPGDATSCSFGIGPGLAEVPADQVPPDFTLVTTSVRLTGGEIPAGGRVERSVGFYIGPKKLDALRSQTPPLNDAIDFGWFTVICLPMLWLMRLINDLLGNWGVAIIVLTIIVKVLTLPLTHKQYKSMAAMKKLQPQLKALQTKLAGDKMKLQQEMMKLYKENKVNPLAGCLPMVLMMPIYFSLYRTIYSAVELYRADFIFWIKDLSEADPYFVTPLLLGALFFVQMRLNPSMSDNPQQKIIMNVMPIMFTAMMLFLPSGLVLYIFVNTILGLVQQIFLYKKEGEATVAAAATPSRAAKRRAT